MGIVNKRLTQPMPIAVTVNSRSRLKTSANKVVPKAGRIAICNTSESCGIPSILTNVKPVPISKVCRVRQGQNILTAYSKTSPLTHPTITKY